MIQAPPVPSVRSFNATARRLVVAALTGYMALAAAPAMANEATATVDAAEECARTKVWESYGQGWAIRTLTSSALASADTRNYVATLYKGNEYRVLTCASEGMKDLDVLLYDANGQIVVRDDDVGREPVITFTPEQTGTYYVVVYARALEPGHASAGAAVAVTYR